MAWTFSLTRKTERLVKGLEKRQKALLESYTEQLEIVLQEPLVGSVLKGDLSGYYCWDWTFRGVSLRVVYKVFEGDKHVIICYFGTRENFYEEVKRYLK